MSFFSSLFGASPRITIFRNYALIGLLLLVSWGIGLLSSIVVSLSSIAHGSSSFLLLVFVEVIIIAVFGFFAYELARPTVIPSFVLAIFIGMFQHDNLRLLVSNPATLTVLTTIGAVFILFGGGLDTPFARFRSLIGPILSLAFFGTLLTALLFTVVLQIVAPSLGTFIPLAAAILVGAALASTDPAAIIPSFKALSFTSPRVKYIAVSESALNDVVGAVLTGVFLSIFAVNAKATSLVRAYSKLFTVETGVHVLREVVLGSLVGLLCFAILHVWGKWKQKHETTGEADSALFLAVPLLAFTLATVIGGNGFLAVFISSLLFNLQKHTQHVEHYFNHTIEGFMKPLIFMLLGAIVDVESLMSVVGIGVSMGFLFMFVIRPLVVFLALSPFMRGKHVLSVRELLFLSFVRETGVIPAVLLIGLQVSGIPGTETVTAIGLWVILLTLLVQPPLTPFVAKILKVAVPVGPLAVSGHAGPIAVLCSRGHSFVQRIKTVADWAQGHGIESVTLLHCLEDKYSSVNLSECQAQAEKLFTSLNAAYEQSGQRPIAFEFLSKRGLLQDNIRSLLGSNSVSIVFVGSKMLDYRMEDVKRIPVPFVFLP